MRNHIVVKIGNNSALFYWYDVDTLEKLKENIEKRYTIPCDCQQVLNSGTSVTNESFQDLYDDRFERDVNLEVEITDQSFDTAIVQSRRKFASQKSAIRKIKFFNLRKWEIFKATLKDLSTRSTVLDIKRHIHSKKQWQPTEEVFILHKNCIILSDEHLLVDLFLDDIGIKSLSFRLLVQTRYLFDPEGNYVRPDNPFTEILPNIEILIPGIEGVVEYPLKQIGSFSVFDVKAYMRYLYGIPCEEIELILNGSSRVPVGYLPIAWTENPDLTAQQAKLLIYHTENIEYQKIYEKNNISMLRQIEIKSFNESSQSLFYSYRGENGQSIEEFIVETLQIPTQNILLYFDNKWTLNYELQTRIRSGEIEPPFLIRFAIQLDENEDVNLLETVKNLNLSCIRSIIVKHPFNENITFCQFSVSKKMTGNSQYEALCAEVRSQHEDLKSASIELHHGGKKISENLENYFVNDEGEINEYLTLYLFVKPSHNENVQRFCHEYDIKLLKFVNINFLTGQFTIDVLARDDDLVKTIGELKGKIYEMKNILPHLQMLHYKEANMAEITDSMKLESLSNNRSESITFDLIVKPAQDINISFICPFYPNVKEALPVFKETDTFAHVKEEFSKLSGIPTGIIFLGSGYIIQKQFLDDEPLWNCSKTLPDRMVIITKKVLLSIENLPEKTQEKREYVISRANVDDDIRALQIELSHQWNRKHKTHDMTLSWRKVNHLTWETKLMDVNDERLVFYVRPKTSRCVIS